jgi:hypothetical protein
MLVYYYEKLSDQQNRYEVPRYASAPQYVDYVSNGYLVLLPDIYLHTGHTHTDHLNSVEAAVKRAIDLGYADPKRVGLHGGSFSGQGGAYISTTSKMFAAIAIRAGSGRSRRGLQPALEDHGHEPSTTTTSTARAGSARIRSTISSCSWISRRSSTRRT